ncbi:hypothetical protein H2200_011891 [Cladophialophora chaetospira]|uniref:BTB domain-containing protein n=1 Tax=Cladophialophora chaetospira TaxID=386627 RepID=A0AA38WYX7_9EURO|nr:hypothetical protein H2200_011891 [Cladophialophora chaetospira]
MADASPPNGEPCGGKDTNESITTSEIIPIFVGPIKKKHLIHACILTSKAPFFKKCLESGMREQAENAIYLPEDDPEAFGIVANWMYTGSMPSTCKCRVLMSAYILADKLCMTNIQDAVMEQLRWNLMDEEIILPVDVDWVWEKTGPGSKLREFMVDALHYSVMQQDEYQTAEGKNEHHLAVDLEAVMVMNGALGYQLYSKIFNVSAVRNQARKKTTSPYLRNCKYHCHADEEECPSRK